MRKTAHILLLIIFFQNNITAQNKYYTIEQIKDTLTKYENPFSGFPRLEMIKIPVSEFRKDTFLMEKAYGLFNKANTKKKKTDSF